MLVALLLSSNSSSGHDEPLSKILFILVQFGYWMKRTSIVFVGQNSEPYPRGELNWAAIALLRSLLYLFMIQKFLSVESLLS